MASVNGRCSHKLLLFGLFETELGLAAMMKSMVEFTTFTQS